jgi:alginate O-acetyltransferase complex protein AlgI
MRVPSLEFFGFTVIVAILFRVAPGAQWRRAVMLAANAVFLAGFASDPAAYAPFAAFLAVGYAALRLIQDGGVRSRWFIAPLVLAILAAFVWLKKYSFVPRDVVLPFPYVVVGLSYIFFRVLHLLIDASQDALPERILLIDYLGYTLNFCCLVSGPIQRYPDYARAGPTAPAPLDVVIAGEALERIIIGFFKVSVVSAALLALHRHALGMLSPDQPLGERVGLGTAIVALYPLYLYCNFSGYTDCVIGAGRFLGLVLPENFAQPFGARNFIEFWSRWHITLSSWLKTYVYNPLLLISMRHLASPRLEPWLAVVAFFVTFFLVGVWHGQTSEFLFFGVLQGGGVAANKLYQISMIGRLGRRRYRALCENLAYRSLTRGMTFAWFAFTLLWFWSNWQQLGALDSMLGGAACLAVGVVLVIAADVSLAALEAVRSHACSWLWLGEPVLLSRYVRTVWGTTLFVVSFAVLALTNMKAPDIVYQAF